jgi:hypothetical protein
MQTDPLAGRFGAEPGAITHPSGATSYPVADPLSGVGAPVPVGGGGFLPGAGQAPPVGGGGLLGQGGWLERNQGLVGHVVGGLGQGLMASGEADAMRKAQRERYQRIAANYEGADPGADYATAAPGGSGQTPTQRFDPRVYGAWEYRYDPQQGRIVRAPVG